MRYGLYLLLWMLLPAQQYFAPKPQPAMHSPCFTNENFQRAFRYVEGVMAEAASGQMLPFEGRYGIMCRWNAEEQSLYFYKNNTLYFRVDAAKGLIPLLKLQKRKYLEECEALFCNLVQKAEAVPLAVYNYTYTDGNNNRWEMSKDSLLYKPMEAAQSSSGTYSGGAPRSVAISEGAFAEGEALLQAALFAEEAHSEQRMMGTAVLTQYLQSKKIRQVILKMRSPEKEAIEAWLKAL